MQHHTTDQTLTFIHRLLMHLISVALINIKHAWITSYIDFYNPLQYTAYRKSGTQDPERTQDPRKTQEPRKTQDPVRTQDPIRTQDSRRTQDFTRTHDPMRTQDPRRTQDPYYRSY